MTPAQQIAAAITWVTVSTEKRPALAPYLAHVLQLLVRVESQEVDTLAVSQRGVMYYNPEYVLGQGAKSLAWGVFHEGLHVALDHFVRAQAIGASVKPGDPISPVMAARAKRANLAQDACINEILREVAKQFGVTLPTCTHGTREPHDCESWIYPETLGQPLGLAFEQRYRLLEQQEQKQQEEQGEGEGDGEGEGESKGDGKDGKDSKGGGKGKGGKPGVGSGGCGSCCGNPTDGEKADEGVGRSDVDMARARRQMAEEIKRMAEKGRGNIPGGLVRWAEVELTPPKVDWRAQTQEAVRNAIAYRPGAVDHHYTRPSRRQGGLGYGAGVPVMAAYRAPVPEVGVIVDTSGSMGSDELSAVASEVAGVLRAIETKITVVAVDAKVQGAVETTTIEEAVAAFKGGGGTDMRPGFDYLEKKPQRPEIVIVLTDGMLGDGYPQVEPHWCRVVWCVVGSTRRRPAPYGVFIDIEDAGVAEEAA